ncbi:FG-GAP-like repeat-containing protein [Bradyrhizobium sp. ARR65]|uniref:FG-GAP-like repeat-containing protein n=1 Tax=Bradyrhizobium sp. ARR65 TaxID=1040989 RepID=UPI000AB96CCD|nr:FG-GAP-like repeat-containing protein [Bradyrhizobium sp. ARR65]
MTLSFSETTYSLGATQWVSIGDLNGDRKPDLVYTQPNNNVVGVMLNTGNGTFTSDGTYSAPVPQNGIVADLNNDGKPDIIVANTYSYSLGVFLGNGDGTFQREVNYPAGSVIPSVAAADLNSDGKLDLVSTSYYDQQVSILLGNGDGTFQPRYTVPVGAVSNYGVTVGDLGNGHQDIVVATPGTGGVANDTISILMGDGTGAFATPITLHTRDVPLYTTIANLGNGHPDLIVANRDSNSVQVFLGNGDGTFQPPQAYAIGGSSYTVAVGDVNGDGIPDVAVEVGTPNGSEVDVLLGNGDGTFQPEQAFPVPGGVTGSIAMADLFGNGKQDIVVTTDAGLDVLTNTSTPPDTPDGPEAPTLTAPSSLNVTAGGSTPVGITASPVDSDDKLSVTISGVPLFESITAPSGDTVTSQLVHGGGRGDTLTFTITAPTGQSVSGLTLNSTFAGKGHPVNTFTVTASNSTSGETGTSAAKSITVTDPPTISQGYTYTTLNDPLATNGTSPNGINNLAQIVGAYVDGSGFHSFLYSGGSYTTVDDPSATANTAIAAGATGINNNGQIVGYYADASGTQHSFLYSGGSYTNFDYPSATNTLAQGINDNGEIVGYYNNGDGNHGFVDNGGVFTTLDDPLNTGGNTGAGGINDNGQIVGTYYDAGGIFHGYLYSGGVFTTIDDPLATQGTAAQGINDNGQIVGYYIDSSGTHGFLDSGGIFTTLTDPVATGETAAFGINDHGQITGVYDDASGRHGFLASPDQDDGPEPPALTAPSSLTVPAGGSKPMGITASPIDSDDTVSVTISGVPLFESITAPSGDTVTSQLVHGGGKGDTLTFTVSAPVGQSISGLTLNSTLPGNGHPVNTFTVTASNSTSGETGTSAAKTITVTDPPASAASGPTNPHSLSDLMSQFGSHDATTLPNQLSGGSVGSLTNTNGSIPDIAALTEHFMAAPFVSGGALGLLPSSLTTAEEQRSFLALHHG